MLFPSVILDMLQAVQPTRLHFFVAHSFWMCSSTPFNHASTQPQHFATWVANLHTIVCGQPSGNSSYNRSTTYVDAASAALTTVVAPGSGPQPPASCAYGRAINLAAAQAISAYLELRLSSAESGSELLVAGTPSVVASLELQRRLLMQGGGAVPLTYAHDSWNDPASLWQALVAARLSSVRVATGVLQPATYRWLGAVAAGAPALSW